MMRGEGTGSYEMRALESAGVREGQGGYRRGWDESDLMRHE